MPSRRESIDLETAALESKIRRRVIPSAGGFVFKDRLAP
jgi:hypothetical protein